MTNEEAIEVLENGAWWDLVGTMPCDSEASVKFHNAFEKAIAALRAQQAPMKLDRSWWEGCAECEAVYGEDDWDCAGFHEYRIVDCYLQYFDHQFGWEGVKIKFCPNCGRPLIEAAWAELEGRISDGTAN